MCVCVCAAVTREAKAEARTKLVVNCAKLVVGREELADLDGARLEVEAGLPLLEVLLVGRRLSVGVDVLLQLLHALLAP